MFIHKVLVISEPSRYRLFYNAVVCCLLSQELAEGNALVATVEQLLVGCVLYFPKPENPQGLLRANLCHASQTVGYDPASYQEVIDELTYARLCSCFCRDFSPDGSVLGVSSYENLYFWQLC